MSRRPRPATPARLAERIAQRLERRDDVALPHSAAGGGSRRARRHPRRSDLLPELEDDPLGELLADARDRDQHRLVTLEDGELEVRDRPAADDREGDLRADAGHGEQEREEAALFGCPEAVQRLQVLADEVVREDLEPGARPRSRQDRRVPRRPGSRCRRPRRRANRRRRRRRCRRATRSSGLPGARLPVPPERRARRASCRRSIGRHGRAVHDRRPESPGFVVEAVMGRPDRHGERVGRVVGRRVVPRAPARS